jgi:hypothetical protein
VDGDKLRTGKLWANVENDVTFNAAGSNFIGPIQ